MINKTKTSYYDKDWSFQELTQELGIADFSSSRQKKIIEDITKSIFQIIVTNAILKLNGLDQKQVFEMLDNGVDPEKIELFFHEKVPTYEKIKSETITNFRKQLDNLNKSTK